MRYFQVSKFNGRNIDEAKGWLTQMEAHFTIKGYGIFTKTTMATLHLIESTTE